MHAMFFTNSLFSKACCCTCTTSKRVTVVKELVCDVMHSTHSYNAHVCSFVVSMTAWS